jgi:hypothetical protein
MSATARNSAADARSRAWIEKPCSPIEIRLAAEGRRLGGAISSAAVRSLLGGSAA